MSRKFNRDLLGLYFIMGSVNTNGRDPLHVLEEALKGGITCFQLREKGVGSLVGEEKLLFAQQCQKLCRQYGVPFIVNDDVELAVTIQADGIHIGQEDDNGRAVRERMGADQILGISAHTKEEVAAAIEDGADYIGIGPIYPTATKTDTRPVSGTKFLSETRQEYPNLPIVGIGGIQLANTKPVIQAGADGVAIISAIAQSPNPELVCQQLTTIIRNGVIAR